MNGFKLDHILNCHPILKTDISRGENTNLFNKDGNIIIDFEAGMWSTALGHSNTRINDVIIKQINKIMNLHSKLTSDVAENLAVNLLKLFHFQDGKAVFLSSGSEAVELGIRISKLVSSGSKILTFSTSYLSAFSNTSFPRNNNLWTEINFLQCSNCRNKECSNKCSLLKDIDFNDISTFVLEPGSSCGRVLFPSYNLVNFVANEVKKHGGSIVVNEVTTGFGRTGEWFGYNHYDIQPDIVALGKCLGNGYPISAVVMSKEVANTVESRNFAYAQSHQNDPLGCTIANEVINIFKEDNMILQSKITGEFFLNQLKEIQNTCSVVKEVRGRGLMLAIELKINNATEIIAQKMLEKGYFIGTTPAWNVLRFYPALTISKNDILSMCKELTNTLKSMEFFNVYEDTNRTESYAKLEFPGTYYLAYRDLIEIITLHVKGKLAVDFGCGTGRSTRLLQKNGFNALGIDISENMIKKAKEIDTKGSYLLIEDGDFTKLHKNFYDLVLSVFTFDNIPTFEKKTDLLKKIKSLLSSDGKIICLVSAPEIYGNEWASFTTKDFPENKYAKSGDNVKIVMTDVDDKRPVEDIIWFEDDYKKVFKESDLKIVKIYKPLGNECEPFQWINETNIPPWTIYVLEN